MNDETTNLDQDDEDILAYTESDEALEAAGTETRVVGLVPMSNPSTVVLYCQC